MLREPGAGGAGGAAGSEARYEAVSKFLADTEDYIHRLAGKVAASPSPLLPMKAASVLV